MSGVNAAGSSTMSMSMSLIVLDLRTLCMAKCLSYKGMVLPTIFESEHRLGKEIAKLRKVRAQYISDPPDHSTYKRLHYHQRYQPTDVDLSVILSIHESVKKAMLTFDTYMYVATNQRWDLLSAAVEKMIQMQPIEWVNGWICDAICGCVQVNDTTGLKMCHECMLNHACLGEALFLNEVCTYVILFTEETVDFLMKNFDIQSILMGLSMKAHDNNYQHNRYWIDPCAFDVMCGNLYFTKMCHKMGYVFTVNDYVHCIYNRMFHVLEFMETVKCRRPRHMLLEKEAMQRKDIRDWCTQHHIDMFCISD